MIASGCPGDDEPPDDPGTLRLAVADGWTRVEDAGEDLFGDERPADLMCDETGYGPEGIDLGFEVDTGLCDYLTVRQPSRAALVPGDVVEIRVSHEELEAPMPTQGHVAVGIDGEVVWEQMVPIPSGPDSLVAEVQITRDVAEGAELQFHVHNHGVNTWLLTSINVRSQS